MFSLPTHSTSGTAITKASVSKYIGAECLQSHLVFVDGTFSASLSDVSKVPTSVTATSVSQLLSGSGADGAQEALSSFLDVPDVSEVKRDSFGSDILSGLSLVIDLLTNLSTHFYLLTQLLTHFYSNKI